MKIYKLFILCFLFCTFFEKNVYAANLTVTCDNSGCLTLPANTPLFSEIQVVPNWSTVKTIQIKNTTQTVLFVSNRVTGGDYTEPSLFNVLNITIKEGDTVLYGPTKITNWIVDKNVSLGGISANSVKDYSFILKLDDVGNEYQNKTAFFDISLDFVASAEESGNSDDEEEEEDDDSDDNDDEDEDAKENDEDTTESINVFESFTSVFEGLVQGATTNVVEDSKQESTETSNNEKVDTDTKGISDEAVLCTNPTWWFLVLLAQVLAAVILYFLSRKYKLLSIGLYIIVSLISAYILFSVSCSWWQGLLALLLGLLFLIPLIPKRQ